MVTKMWTFKKGIKMVIIRHVKRREMSHCSSKWWVSGIWAWPKIVIWPFQITWCTWIQMGDFNKLSYEAFDILKVTSWWTHKAMILAIIISFLWYMHTLWERIIHISDAWDTFFDSVPLKWWFLLFSPRPKLTL